MKKDPRVYLAQMLECIEKIEQFTAAGKEKYLENAMVHDAVLRNLTVIGEAAKRVDDQYRVENPEIPWRPIAGLRDILIHQYEGVDLDRVWEIVQRDLPSVKKAIATILPPLEQLERELAGEDNGKT